MHSTLLKLLAGVSLLASAALAAEPALNALTPAEKDAGWRLLWDGHSSAGWRSARADSFPAHGWAMKDGLLCVEPSGGREGGVGGDIITAEQFADFELTLDFRLSEGANSGIKYYVDPELNKGEGSAIGIEYQLLDDARHPDAKLGRNGNRTLGSVYDLYPASAIKPFHPPGEWNTARIVSKHGHVEHWLNNVKVAEFERGTEQFRKDVAESKYKVWPHFGEASRGPILLQDHGDAVCFRNIKIRVLSSN